MASEPWVRVASESEFEQESMKVAEVDGDLVLVCKIAGRYFAVEDRCSHDDGPLGDGSLVGDQIECPRHGARFDVTSGRALSMPAVAPIKSYEVKVEAGEIFVRP